MNKLLPVLYFLIGGIQLFTLWFEGEYPATQASSKIALVPVLILITILGFFKSREKLLVLVLIALFFSLMGDIFLLDETLENNFIYGLGAFLIAHIIYGISFIKSKQDNFEIQLIYKAPIYMIMLLVATVLVYVKLRKGMGILEFPVLIYMASILFMSIMALNRYKKVAMLSFWMVFIGSLIFMVSDTLIAFNKFNAWFDHNQFYVMMTYIIAQFLIVQGSVVEARRLRN